MPPTRGHRASVLVLALGTLLNPLNSSMIAVALVGLQRDFDVGIATSTWLVSGFYLAAAVAQPLMGRLADQVGARRLFVAGLVLMGVASALAPLAPGYWWLVAVRAVQALATSTAYPCAQILIRAGADSSAPPARELAVLNVAAASSAALGPVLGGVLMAVAGWPAVFLANVPITAVAAVLAVRVLPRVGAADAARPSGLRLADVDLPGIVAFAGCLGAFLVFLLSLARAPWWGLVPVVLLLGVALVLRELRADPPFLDVRGLRANGALRSVLLQQVGVNLVFYCAFFGLPQWLEHVRGYGPGLVGLLVLPTTVVGILVTPLTARAVARRGSTGPLLVGAVLLLVGTLALRLLDDTSGTWLFLAVAVVLGLPGGVTSLSLQTALYDASPPERAGASAGLFQTCRYLGGIGATSVLGILFERTMSTGGLHDLAGVMTAVSVLLVILVALSSSRRGGDPAGGSEPGR